MPPPSLSLSLLVFLLTVWKIEAFLPQLARRKGGGGGTNLVPTIEHNKSFIFNAGGCLNFRLKKTVIVTYINWVGLN